MDLPIDFKELLAEFESEGVEAVVVGGYAVAFHGRPRATKDLDVLLAGDDENLARAARALERFGAPMVVVDGVRRMGPTDVVYMGQPPLRIDLLRTVDGVDTAGVLARSVVTELDGVRVHVISLDDLIANKHAAGRPQDVVDAGQLERVRAKRG